MTERTARDSPGKTRKVAFVDTSVLAAWMFKERTAKSVAKLVSAYDSVCASSLLEAELRSAAQREKLDAELPLKLLDRLSMLHPDRSLREEVGRVLSAGYLRGADLWHLACALFLDPSTGAIDFLTLDQSQADVAVDLGFRVRTIE